jgi:hypothetical protein
MIHLNETVKSVNAVQIVGINPTKKEGSDGMNILAMPYNTGTSRDRADGKTAHAWANNVATRFVATSDFSSFRVWEGDYLADGPDRTRAMFNAMAMAGKENLAEFYGKELASATRVTLGECFAKYKKSKKVTDRYDRAILANDKHTWLIYGYQVVPMWYFERPDGFNENAEARTFEYTDPNVPGVVKTAEGYCRNLILTDEEAAYAKLFKLVNQTEQDVVNAVKSSK